MSNILISTPAYGGMITLHTSISLHEAMNYAQSKGVACHFLGKMNESLIQRARNDHASKALQQNFDKILFVDSDVGFQKEWIYKLWSYGKAVVGGTYPMKDLPIKLNINLKTKTEYKLLEKPPHVQPRDLLNLKLKLSDSQGLIKVLHLPTGFLMIDRQVLQVLSKKVPKYGNTYEFFPVGVNKALGILESEDWGFCRLCQENDIDVHFDPELICDHIGTFNYSPNLSP